MIRPPALGPHAKHRPLGTPGPTGYNDHGDPQHHRRRGGTPGPLALQAAIAAVHCRAARPEDTQWPAVVRLYDALQRVQPSPIVLLNRAVAVAMAESPQRGLELIDELAAANHLENYHLLHAARADMHRRLGLFSEAATDSTLLPVVVVVATVKCSP